MSAIPKLRFKEFYEDWKNYELGSLTDVSKLAGYEFTKHIRYEDRGEIIALRALNIKNNGLRLDDVKFIDNSELSKLSRSKLYVGDIMFTYIGTIGEVAVIEENEKYYLAPNVSRIRPDQELINSYFLMNFFIRPKFKNQEIPKFVATSSQPSLTMENVRKFEIVTPPLPEQKKIADFLGAVDEKIAGLRERERLLTQYKKGAMQKIFSQTLRFKADDGSDFPDWGKSEFGEMVHRAKEKYNPVNGKEDWVSIEMESLDQNSGRLLQTFKANSLKSLKTKFQKGDVLFGKLRPNLRKFYYAEFNGVCTSEIWVLRGEQIIGKFLFYLVQLEKFSFACGKTTGSKMPRADWQFVGTTPFQFPYPEEQQKIADFLSAIDEKITAVSAQITQMQDFKKGLLQQMFV